MKFTGKEQCWERMRCGRDQKGDCPAYPDYGRLCWPIAGTKACKGAQGSFARRIGDCEAGEFFRSVVYDGID